MLPRQGGGRIVILDLQWLLFALLLALVGGAVWAGSGGSVAPRRVGRPALGELLGPALDQAPFGLLVLDGPRHYRYANELGRRLLELPTVGTTLPSAAWVPSLDADRAAARRQGAGAGRYRTVILDIAPELAPELLPLAGSESEPGDWSAASRAETVGPALRWWVTSVGEVDLVVLLEATGERRAEAAMRSLVNDLAHEVRTPLATVLTHLEVLGLERLSEALRQQSLMLIKAEVGRMIRLLHQLSELGRLDAAVDLERRPLDLLRLAEETIAQVRPGAGERRITVAFEAGTPLPAIEGDEDRLRQVLLNLLDNAVKYSRPGDGVTLSLQPVAGGIDCAVADTGPGIPAAQLAHVTRRFYRGAPREVAGSGLGLTLVEEIVRRHGGRLTIESRADAAPTGTTVRFHLPADRAPLSGRSGHAGIADDPVAEQLTLAEGGQADRRPGGG